MAVEENVTTNAERIGDLRFLGDTNPLLQFRLRIYIFSQVSVLNVGCHHFLGWEGRYYNVDKQFTDL